MNAVTLLGLEIISQALQMAATLTDALSRRGEITSDDIRRASKEAEASEVSDAMIEAAAADAARKKHDGG